MGQYRAVLAGTWWYWVSMGQYWLVLGVTGSVWDGTGWFMVLVMVEELVAGGEDWRGCCGLGGHLEEEYLLELIFDGHDVCPVLWSFPSS